MEQVLPKWEREYNFVAWFIDVLSMSCDLMFWASSILFLQNYWGCVVAVIFMIVFYYPAVSLLTFFFFFTCFCGLPVNYVFQWNIGLSTETVLTSQMLNLCNLFRYSHVSVLLTNTWNYSCCWHCLIFKEWDLVENMQGVLEYQTRYYLFLLSQLPNNSLWRK